MYRLYHSTSAISDFYHERQDYCRKHLCLHCYNTYYNQTTHGIISISIIIHII